MPDKAKSSIIVFIVLILISLCFAGAGFFLLQREKIKNFSLQEEMDTLKIKENAAEAKLEEYKKTISQLELKLKDAQGNIDTLTTTLDQEKKAKQDALDELQQVKADLDQQKSLRSDLESKLSQSQKDVVKALAQLKDLESKRSQLETKLKDLEAKAQQPQAQNQGVELGTIVVGAEGAASPSQGGVAAGQSKAAPTVLEGKVLVVNKDYNFVVINLGSKDGVNAGDVFNLYHNNNYIGDIKVEKIHESMSAADFTSTSIKEAVSEGDRVVQKAK